MTSRIRGIGTDIVEIARIEEAIKKEAFLQRLFTEKEIAYCRRFQNPAPCFAGRFAAKEAVAKALGTGFGQSLRWLDIEILPDAQGKPLVHYQNTPIELSISHGKSQAIAMVIVFEKD